MTTGLRPGLQTTPKQDRQEKGLRENGISLRSRQSRFRKQWQMTDQPSLLLKKEWPDITVEYGLLESVGDFEFAMPKHAISVAFIPHNRVTWSVIRRH